MDNLETIKKNLIKVEEIKIGDFFGNGSFSINLNEDNILYSKCGIEEWRKFVPRLDLIKQSFFVSNLLCKSGSMWCYEDIIDTKVEESFLEVRMTYDNKPLILRFDRSNELKCNSIILTFGDLVYDLETFDWLTSKSKIKEDLVNLFNNSIFFDYKDESKPKINEEELKEMISMFFPDYRGFEVKVEKDYFGGNLYKIGPLRDIDMGSGFQRVMRLYPALKRSKEYNLPLFVRDFDESLHPLLAYQLFGWFRKDNDSQIFCRFQNVSNPYI